MAKTTITITIDEETYKAIKKKAAFEKRSFSAQVDWILSDFVSKNLKRHPNRPTKQQYQEKNRQEPEEEVSNEEVQKALDDLYGRK